MFWLGLLIGLFIGGFLGIAIICCLKISKEE